MRHTTKLNVLVVEDNEVEQRAARALLGSHNVTIVRTFSEFMGRLSGTEWDAILTDLNFPIDEGGETEQSGMLVYILAQKIGVPAIVISRHDHREVKTPLKCKMEEVGVSMTEVDSRSRNERRHLAVKVDTLRPPTEEEITTVFLKKEAAEEERYKAEKKREGQYPTSGILPPPRVVSRNFVHDSSWIWVKNWPLALKQALRPT